jgi:hypothetical protein
LDAREGDSPRVGGWGWAIFFFGLIGSAIGYFATKDESPARANHIMKWGLIWTIPSAIAWIVTPVLLLGAVVSGGPSSGAAGRAEPVPSQSAVATTSSTLPSDVTKAACPVASPSADAHIADVAKALTAMKIFAVDHHQLTCAEHLLGTDMADQVVWLFEQPGVITGDSSFPKDPGEIDGSRPGVPRNIPGTTFVRFLRSYKVNCSNSDDLRCARVVNEMMWPTGEHYDEFNYVTLKKQSRASKALWIEDDSGYLTKPR